MTDAITFGELLIDFVPTISGVTLIEAPAFKKAPGGAPANVAVGLSRLGVKAGFMGKVGDDAFGHFLINTLANNGVDTSGVCYSKEARTALAFVSLQKNGERDFMFYRNPSADMLLTTAEVNAQVIQAARLFHYGSISLICEPVRSAHFHALEIAQKAGCILSYDPNLRLNLWPGAKEAKEGMLSGWPKAQVIKVSEEELAFLSDETDLVKGARKLWHADLRLIVVTRGEQGCFYITPDFHGTVPGFKTKSVDTTGAGDGFVAGLLKGILGDPDIVCDQAALESVCRFSNAVGALTTTKRGAIPALPTTAQVERFLARA